MANVLDSQKQVAKRPRRHMIVLHIAPVLSAAAAVRAAIVQEFRSLEPTEES